MIKVRPRVANDDDKTIFLVIERKPPGKVVPIEEQKLGFSMGRKFAQYAGHIWSSSNKITVLTTEGHQQDIEKIAALHDLQVRLKNGNEPLLG